MALFTVSWMGGQLGNKIAEVDAYIGNKNYKEFLKYAFIKIQWGS
jgi:hypothetical protein